MSGAPRQQALTVFLPISAGRAAEFARELTSASKAVQEGLAAATSVHFAALAVLPEVAGYAPGLLLETSFDGELGPHLAELEAVLSVQIELLRSAAASAGSFGELLQRHALRALAWYFAHRGVSLATLRADAVVARRAEALIEHERATLVATDAQRTAAAFYAELAPLVPTLAAAAPSDGGSLLERAGTRWLELARAALLVPWFELADAWTRADAAQLNDEAAPSPPAQSPFVHVVPLKPGPPRAALVELLTWLLDGEPRRPLGPAAPFGIHSARWVLLPDGRLAFVAWHDGHAAAWLDRCIEVASHWISLIWGQTRDFPATRCGAWGGARQEPEFKRWVRAYQLSAQIWYSAYPELSVSDVQRNRRRSALLTGPLDERRSRELCALL